MERVRMAMVGLGGWGRNVLRAFGNSPGCELVRLCDTVPELLARSAALYPMAAAEPDYERLLEESSVDAVALATPAPDHFRMARQALSAGKHLFVEKPMTLRAAEAEELVELAERAGRKLMVGHLLLYHPAVEYIRAQIQAGELGELYYMYCQRLNLGVVRRGENAFWSLAPHDVSVVLYLFGAEPDRVTATGQCYLQRGVEDVVFAGLHFPDGRMAQIHVSWLDPHKERRMVVVGSRKMLAFDDMAAAEKIRIYNKGAHREPDAVGAAEAITVRHGDIQIPHLPADEPLDREARHFLECVLHDRVPRSDGRAGLAVVRILEQVEECLRQHR